MYVLNITANDYDNITEHNNVTNICTNNEKNIDISIPTISLPKPCGLSFLCLMS